MPPFHEAPGIFFDFFVVAFWIDSVGKKPKSGIMNHHLATLSQFDHKRS